MRAQTRSQTHARQRSHPFATSRSAHRLSVYRNVRRREDHHPVLFFHVVHIVSRDMYHLFSDYFFLYCLFFFDIKILRTMTSRDMWV